MSERNNWSITVSQRDTAKIICKTPFPPSCSTILSSLQNYGGKEDGVLYSVTSRTSSEQSPVWMLDSLLTSSSLWQLLGFSLHGAIISRTINSTIPHIPVICGHCPKLLILLISNNLSYISLHCFFLTSTHCLHFSQPFHLNSSCLSLCI